MGYLKSKYLYIAIEMEYPMPKWRLFLWKLLGFDYVKEE